MTDQLAGLFTGGAGGHAVSLLSVGTLDEWNPTTFANVVTTSDGVTYTNLAVAISFFAPDDHWEEGDAVLLAQTAGAPVILSTLWRPGPTFPL